MDILRRVGSKLIGSIARERGALLMVMLIGIDSLIVYSLIAGINMEDSTLYMLVKAPFYYFAGLFVPGALVVVAGIIECAPVRRLLVAAIVLIHAVIMATDLFLWRSFGTILDQAKIEILLTTNPYTAQEFLALYVGLGGGLLIAATAILLFFGMRRVARALYEQKWLLRVEAAVLTIAMLSFFTFWSAALFIPNKGKAEMARGGFKTSSLMGGREMNAVASTALTRVAFDTRLALRSLGNNELIESSIAAREEQILADNGTAPYVIFILGESNDRNRMSAYGYKNDTTPLLKKRLADGEAILFTDTIACANGTGQAMSRIFSFADKATKSPWYENGCLIDVMKKAGYHTAWISNQSAGSRFGVMDDVLSRLANEAVFTATDGSQLMNKGRPFDGELLPLLDVSLAENTAARSFYVVHLTGTHEKYSERYPAEFARFTAADETGANDNQREVRAAYDNAMLYNDYVVDEIIARFADKNAVVIYLSDHGSDVYDNDRDFMGHSDESLRNPHMIEIPMLVWGSESFWQSHAELKQSLAAAADRPYSTENVIHFILDLAGLKTTSYDSKKSILDPDNIYQAQPRIYGGQPYERLR